jgi:hypothetical protein
MSRKKGKYDFGLEMFILQSITHQHQNRFQTYLVSILKGKTRRRLIFVFVSSFVSLIENFSRFVALQKPLTTSE